MRTNMNTDVICAERYLLQCQRNQNVQVGMRLYQVFVIIEADSGSVYCLLKPISFIIFYNTISKRYCLKFP